MLKMRLLGTFDVRLDGDPVDISSRAPRTLLAYLILNPESDHPRDKLGGILWPESEQSNARSNLRHALWRLRKKIGDAHLVSDRNTIGLAPDSDLWTDVMTLQRELGDQPSADEMIDVISVYQGELLPGFYEDWVVLERERLQAIYERRVQTALDRLAEEERWDEVLQWGERWIAFGHGICLKRWARTSKLKRSTSSSRSWSRSRPDASALELGPAAAGQLKAWHKSF